MYHLSRTDAGLAGRPRRSGASGFWASGCATGSGTWVIGRRGPGVSLMVPRDRLLPLLLPEERAVLQKPARAGVVEVLAVAAPDDDALPEQGAVLQLDGRAVLAAHRDRLGPVVGGLVGDRLGVVLLSPWVAARAGACRDHPGGPRLG